MAATGVGLVVLWVLFGDIELAAAGALLLGATLTASLFVAVNRAEVAVGRRISPPLVHDGDQATVTLVIRNPGATSRNLVLIDRVDGLGVAEFALARAAAGEVLSARYRIRCHPRGILPVGPLTVSIRDPLDLARKTSTRGPIDRLIVYPAVEELSGLPRAAGRDPTMRLSRPEHHTARGGEDFSHLRSYHHGDDLRRVHWPSSAKRDELLIRQLDTPWQARGLVLLDVRSEVYESAACFERSVQGAASVVRHLSGVGFDADLWAGGPMVDTSHHAVAMEALATVERLDTVDMADLGHRLRRVGGGGALVMVTGLCDPPLLGLWRLLSARYPATVLMTCSLTISSSLISFQRAGAAAVSVTPDVAWGPAWLEGMRRTWRSASAG